VYLYILSLCLCGYILSFQVLNRAADTKQALTA